MAAKPRGDFGSLIHRAMLDGGHGCACQMLSLRTDASSPLEHVRKTARNSDLET